MDIKEMVGKIDSATVELKSLINIAIDYAETHDGIEEVDNLYVLLEKIKENIYNLHKITQENLPNTINI